MKSLNCNQIKIFINLEIIGEDKYKKKIFIFWIWKVVQKIVHEAKLKSGKMCIWTEATTSKNPVVRIDCKEEAKS